LASKQGGTAGTPVPYEIVDFMRDGSFFIWLLSKRLFFLDIFYIFIDKLTGVQGARLLRDEWDR
jgi:hypothetical protein